MASNQPAANQPDTGASKAAAANASSTPAAGGLPEDADTAAMAAATLPPPDAQPNAGKPQPDGGKAPSKDGKAPPKDGKVEPPVAAEPTLEERIAALEARIKAIGDPRKPVETLAQRIRDTRAKRDAMVVQLNREISTLQTKLDEACKTESEKGQLKLDLTRERDALSAELKAARELAIEIEKSVKEQAERAKLAKAAG